MERLAPQLIRGDDECIVRRTVSDLAPRVDDSKVATPSRLPKGDARIIPTRSVFVRRAEHLLDFVFLNTVPEYVRQPSLWVEVEAKVH